MTNGVIFAEIWRGAFLESLHRGHAVVCGAGGEIVESWGDPQRIVYPRSSAKMIQALPLIESGAAEAWGLTAQHLALACASHSGETRHVDAVNAWLAALELSESDLRCGPKWPDRREDQNALAQACSCPDQRHHDCSGKHSGFLTVARHQGNELEYAEPDHPVQRACLEAFERVTGEVSPGFGIDGCSVPNFATTLHGLARAMAHYATADADSAEGQLVSAMASHPEMVAGEGRACTRLMQAMSGRSAVKTGAEGVFVAILPAQKLGIALKIEDGATRAAECAIAALLTKYGALDAAHPVAQSYTRAPILNRRDIVTGYMKATPELCP